MRAFPNVSKTNSEAGSWAASFDPFFPGLLTLSSSNDLMASRRFSDFPLPVSPLEEENKGMSKEGYVNLEDDSREYDGLVLHRPPHMIVGVISNLKDVGWKRLLVV